MKYCFNMLFITCLISFILLSFKTDNVVDMEDVDKYLQVDNLSDQSILESEFKFWNRKFNIMNHEYLFLVKMANAKSSLFDLNGKVKELSVAINCLEKAAELSRYTDVMILRKLASNYISSHQFCKALNALNVAHDIGEDAEQTNKMLFDVKMELGLYQEAYEHLENIQDKISFDYLIRRSKWEDHVGALDNAVYLMEFALLGAKSHGDNIELWALTNLADYYGHQGKVRKSYAYYLKALEIDPANAYAKKGIAWILLSHDRDYKAASLILKSIQSYNHALDYDLLLSDIASLTGNTILEKMYKKKFLSETEKLGTLKVMFNKYLIELYCEDSNSLTKAYNLAKHEVHERPTAQSYALLALVEFKTGNKQFAYRLVKDFIIEKTFEPEPLLISAKILKSLGEEKLIPQLYSELKSAIYELGPMNEIAIQKLLTKNVSGQDYLLI